MESQYNQQYDRLGTNNTQEEKTRLITRRLDKTGNSNKGNREH